MQSLRVAYISPRYQYPKRSRHVNARRAPSRGFRQETRASTRATFCGAARVGTRAPAGRLANGGTPSGVRRSRVAGSRRCGPRDPRSTRPAGCTRRPSAGAAPFAPSPGGFSAKPTPSPAPRVAAHTRARTTTRRCALASRFGGGSPVLSLACAPARGAPPAASSLGSASPGAPHRRPARILILR